MSFANNCSSSRVNYWSLTNGRSASLGYASSTSKKLPTEPQSQARGAKNQKSSPTEGNKIRSGCLTRAFLGTQKRVELLHQPCILGAPQREARQAKNHTWSQAKGSKINQKRLPQPCLLGGLKEGGKATPPLHSPGLLAQARLAKKSEVVPNKGDQNRKWLPHPCLLGGPKEGGNATSPCVLGDPQQRGTK